MNRRQFLEVAAAAALSTSTSKKAASRSTAETAMESTSKNQGRVPMTLESFDYSNVHLGPGPLAERLQSAINYYLAIPNDDILIGFRRHAQMSSPGQDLGGWCSGDSALVFGQWLSAFARLYKVTGNTALRDKAVFLMTEWGKTLRPDQTYGHYGYDKFVCGLVDMAHYADAPGAIPLLSGLTDNALLHLGLDRLNATDADSQGGFFNGQMEWYTLPENLYRAYLITGDEKYRAFAKIWDYPNYFGMFNGTVKATPDGFHAYSHVNALSSAAMTYIVTGNQPYLETITNAYDYFQKTQCYATGGYGPGEKLMRPDGELGDSIVHEPNEKFLSGTKGRSFETPCGTYAIFKLTRYLQTITGKAHYGDWMERAVYNGIGAALPMQGRGETFYYADYRMNGAHKSYFDAPWPCCSGTYFQDMAELHDIIYYHNKSGIFVNLYVPSDVAWVHGGQHIKLTQTTTYPASDAVHFAIETDHTTEFALNFRIPEWAHGASVTVNGTQEGTTAQPGQWMEVKRMWKNGDTIQLVLPLTNRTVPIDTQHPNRAAYVRGPVVLVQPNYGAAGASIDPKRLVPFAAMVDGTPYTMYTDLSI